jgi:hypothetical protein
MSWRYWEKNWRYWKYDEFDRCRCPYCDESPTKRPFVTSERKTNIHTVTEVIETEPQRVSNWRARIAESAGADPETIEKIASSAGHVDLTEWLTLVKNGCPPNTAFEILKPL